MIAGDLLRRELGCVHGVPRTCFRSLLRDFSCLPTHVLRHYDDEEPSLPMGVRYGRSYSRLLCVWEEGGSLCIVRSGEEGMLGLARRWLAHRDAVFDCCWSCDDRSLRSASGDCYVCQWDTETMRLLETFKGHEGSVKTLRSRQSDDNVFASAGRDGHIMLWDARVPNRRNAFGMNEKPPVAEFLGAHGFRSHRVASNDATSHSKSVTSLVFAADDTLLVSSGADGFLKYWDIRAIRMRNLGRVKEPQALVSFAVRLPQRLLQLHHHHQGPSRPHGITCIAMSPHGSRIAVSSLDDHIYEYNLFDPDPDHCKVYNAPISSFYSKAVYSPYGYHIASGSSSLHINIFDTSSSDDTIDPIHRLEDHSLAVLGVDWSHLDNQIASCSDDGTVRLWTVETSRPHVKRRKQVEPQQQVNDDNDQMQQQQHQQQMQQQVQQQQQQPQRQHDEQHHQANRGPQQSSILNFFRPL